MSCSRSLVRAARACDSVRPAAGCTCARMPLGRRLHSSRCSRQSWAPARPPSWHWQVSIVGVCDGSLCPPFRSSGRCAGVALRRQAARAGAYRGLWMPLRLSRVANRLTRDAGRRVILERRRGIQSGMALSGRAKSWECEQRARQCHGGQQFSLPQPMRCLPRSGSTTRTLKSLPSTICLSRRSSS